MSTRHAFLIAFFLSFPKTHFVKCLFYIPYGIPCADFLKAHLAVVKRWLSPASETMTAACTRTPTTKLHVSGFTLSTSVTGSTRVAHPQTTGSTPHHPWANLALPLQVKPWAMEARLPAA